MAVDAEADRKLLFRGEFLAWLNDAGSEFACQNGFDLTPKRNTRTPRKCSAGDVPAKTLWCCGIVGDQRHEMVTCLQRCLGYCRAIIVVQM